MISEDNILTIAVSILMIYGILSVYIGWEQDARDYNCLKRITTNICLDRYNGSVYVVYRDASSFSCNNFKGKDYLNLKFTAKELEECPIRKLGLF